MCPKGSYSLEASSECILCPPGKACPLPFIEPITCDVGHHTYGDSGATSCKACPPGHFCPHPRYVQYTCIMCFAFVILRKHFDICTALLRNL